MIAGIQMISSMSQGYAVRLSALVHTIVAVVVVRTASTPRTMVKLTNALTESVTKTKQHA
jgi:hypothetical protein